VKTGRNQPTIHQIREVLPGVEAIDRTSINAWEDEDLVAAIKATGRKKLIMVALWTEVCLVFPVLDALKEGYEVYPVVEPWRARHSKRTGPGLSE
jgi:nicotinamidase-related amidase